MRIRISFFSLEELGFIRLVVDVPYGEVLAKAIDAWMGKAEWIFCGIGYSVGAWLHGEEVFSDDMLKYGGKVWVLRCEGGCWLLWNGEELMELRKVVFNCEVVKWMPKD